MTNHVVRLYALAASLLVLFLTWAAIASHPRSSGSRSGTQDPRVVAIHVREQRLRQEAIVVRRVVAGRWNHYRVALAARQRQIATAQRRQQQAAASLATSSAPSVQVVTLPPLTVTRTS